MKMDEMDEEEMDEFYTSFLETLAEFTMIANKSGEYSSDVEEDKKKKGSKK
jgi:hypothetical protein